MLGYRHLSITGGEPLVHPDLSRILSEALKRPYATVRLKTNGMLLNGAWMSLILQHRGRLVPTLSLDGPRWLHDRNRGRGALHQTMARLRFFSAEVIPFCVSTNVTAPLVPVMDEWIHSVIEELPHLQTLFVFINAGDGGRDPLTRDLEPEELVQISTVVSNSLRRGAPILMAYPPLNPLLRRLGVLPDQLYTCSCAENRLAILATGDIVPCHTAWYPLGRYGDITLREALQSATAKRLRRRRFPLCSTCADRYICSNCRSYVLHRTGSLFGNDGWCEKIKEHSNGLWV